MIFPSAENGPFLLVEATVCSSFCYGRETKVEHTKIIVQSACNSTIEGSTIAKNGCDCDISTHGLLLSCDNVPKSDWYCQPSGSGVTV